MNDMWNLIKRIYHFIMSIILYSIFVILIIVILMVGAYFVDQYMSVKSGESRPPLFGAYVIISPSMVPNINVLDAIVTVRTDAEKLKKNDVITFISNDPAHKGITITHRIVGIKKTSSGGYAYRTKGDNNNVEDKTLVSHDEVLGKVILRIPYIGYLQQFLTTKFGWIIVIVVPALFIMIGDVVKIVRVIIVKEDDEEDKKKKDSYNENYISQEIQNLI